MDYMDRRIALMNRLGASGYFHKDSNLIGFWVGPDVVWYRQIGNTDPVKIDRGTPEQRFNLLNHARFNRLKNKI